MNDTILPLRLTFGPHCFKGGTFSLYLHLFPTTTVAKRSHFSQSPLLPDKFLFI